MLSWQTPSPIQFMRIPSHLHSVREAQSTVFSSSFSSSSALVASSSSQTTHELKAAQKTVLAMTSLLRLVQCPPPVKNFTTSSQVIPGVTPVQSMFSSARVSKQLVHTSLGRHLIKAESQDSAPLSPSPARRR
ncbi:unnamed protein product [Pseudo-nitzschia multistriata]|uniref:Uncharacterized protein n=1 Tax=Pseudo-nitzschia multistriata TaxID=183589 RepID=A0A448Z4K8_9STRA|nr:unnamed protein product [Pseudo-nitzschia multistriata]